MATDKGLQASLAGHQQVASNLKDAAFVRPCEVACWPRGGDIGSDGAEHRDAAGHTSLFVVTATAATTMVELSSAASHAGRDGSRRGGCLRCNSFTEGLLGRPSSTSSIGQATGPVADQHLAQPEDVVAAYHEALKVVDSEMYGNASYGAELATGRPLLPGGTAIMRLLRPLPGALVARPPLICGLLMEPVAIRAARGRRLKVAASPPLLTLISACLALDPRRHPSARELLRLPYVWNMALAAAGNSSSSPPQATATALAPPPPAAANPTVASHGDNSSETCVPTNLPRPPSGRGDDSAPSTAVACGGAKFQSAILGFLEQVGVEKAEDGDSLALGVRHPRALSARNEGGNGAPSPPVMRRSSLRFVPADDGPHSEGPHGLSAGMLFGSTPPARPMRRGLSGAIVHDRDPEAEGADSSIGATLALPESSSRPASLISGPIGEMYPLPEVRAYHAARAVAPKPHTQPLLRCQGPPAGAPPALRRRVSRLRSSSVELLLSTAVSLLSHGGVKLEGNAASAVGVLDDMVSEEFEEMEEDALGVPVPAGRGTGTKRGLESTAASPQPASSFFLPPSPPPPMFVATGGYKAGGHAAHCSGGSMRHRDPVAVLCDMPDQAPGGAAAAIVDGYSVDSGAKTSATAAEAGAAGCRPAGHDRAGCGGLHFPNGGGEGSHGGGEGGEGGRPAASTGGIVRDGSGPAKGKASRRLNSLIQSLTRRIAQGRLKAAAPTAP